MTENEQKSQETEEETLEISNQDLGRISPDAQAICSAIYALAREVRVARKVMHEQLDDIGVVLSRIEIPVYDGAIQVETSSR